MSQHHENIFYQADAFTTNKYSFLRDKEICDTSVHGSVHGTFVSAAKEKSLRQLVACKTKVPSAKVLEG